MKHIYEYYRKEDERLELSTSAYQDVYELKEILGSLLDMAMEASVLGDYRKVFSALRSTKDVIDETIEILETRRVKAKKRKARSRF